MPNPLRKAIKALAQQGYLKLNHPVGHLYSYAAINVLKISGLAMLYQPLYGIKTSRILGKTAPERDCEDRWELISTCLDDGPGIFMDLGSQLGYFVFKMAEKGYFGIGIERNRPSCSMARHLTHVNGIDSTMFLCEDLSPETIGAMPRADVTFCLSIFHHWVREHGLEYADAMMQVVADKCKSQLLFETGQSNEQSGRWPEILSFMGDDPRGWIDNYLRSLGFSDVRCLGEVPTHVSSSPRYLFVAENP